MGDSGRLDTWPCQRQSIKIRPGRGPHVTYHVPINKLEQATNQLYFLLVNGLYLLLSRLIIGFADLLLISPKTSSVFMNVGSPKMVP